MHGGSNCPARCIATGGFNFVLEEEGRCRGDGSGWSPGDSPRARLSHKLFPHRAGLHQGQDTRRGQTGKAAHITSR
eukprot:2155447-Pyramimonas_sp.AAC.1